MVVENCIENVGKLFLWIIGWIKDNLVEKMGEKIVWKSCVENVCGKIFGNIVGEKTCGKICSTISWIKGLTKCENWVNT